MGVAGKIAEQQPNLENFPTDLHPSLLKKFGKSNSPVFIQNLLITH